jgi:uncharacterized protein (TIGR02246 family)
MNADENAVAAVLATYQKALNQSDTEAVMKLYASDGVFMPQHSPSSIGADAVRKAYVDVFKAITLNVVFNVAANQKRSTAAKALHHRQIDIGLGLIVSSNIPTMHNVSGRIELLSRSRNLSMSDQSWTESLRKTTTTPAKPARVTATCAAVLRASPGSIISDQRWVLRLCPRPVC